MSKMVAESITLGQRCRQVPSSGHYFVFPGSRAVFHRWYTSMVGKQSSLTALVTLLRTHSVRSLVPIWLTLNDKYAYRSPTMPLLSWSRATPAAGRSRGPLQTYAYRTYVQIYPPIRIAQISVPNQLSIFLSFSRTSRGRAHLRYVGSFRLERRITSLSVLRLL